MFSFVCLCNTSDIGYNVYMNIYVCIGVGMYTSEWVCMYVCVCVGGLYI